jgi:hypothetical protein
LGSPDFGPPRRTFLGLTHTTTLVLPANLVMIDTNSIMCLGDGSAPPTNYP